MAVAPPHEFVTKKARPTGELAPQVTERAICTPHEDALATQKTTAYNCLPLEGKVARNVTDEV